MMVEESPDQRRTLSEYRLPREPWRDRGLRRGILNVFVLFSANLACGYDLGLVGTQQALTSWNDHFDHPKGIRLGLLTTISLFAQIATSWIPALISDRYGRKVSLFVGACLGLSGTLISALGGTVAPYALGRCLAGTAITFYFTTAGALIAEITHPRLRTTMQTGSNVAFQLGALLAALIALGSTYWANSFAWRVVVLIEAWIPIPILRSAWTSWLAESPRWLVAQGRVDEASSLLRALHPSDVAGDELANAELQEILVAHAEASITPSAGLREFFTDLGARRRLYIIVWMAWTFSMTGGQLTSVYLPLLSRQVGLDNPSHLTAIVSASYGLSLCAVFLAIWLIRQVGRKTLALNGMIATTVLMVIFTALTGHYAESGGRATAIVAIVFLVLWDASYAAWMSGLLYLCEMLLLLLFSTHRPTDLPEILPYRLRSRGMSLYSALSSLGFVYMTLVSPAVFDAIGYHYYIMLIGLNVLTILGGWFVLVETRGRTLEEVQAVFLSDS